MTDSHHIRRICDSIHDALALAEHPPAGKPGQGGSAGQSRPPMPTSILDAKLTLKTILVSWARLIGEEGEFVIDCDDDELSITGWIYTKADWLAEHPAADEFVDEVSSAVRALRAPYTARDELEYCGVHQGEQIWVRKGQETALMPDATVAVVADLKQQQLAQLQEVIGTPALIAETIQTFLGFKITAKRIATTHSNDQRENRSGFILEAQGTEGRSKTFKLGDVLKRFGIPTCVEEASEVS